MHKKLKIIKIVAQEIDIWQKKVFHILTDLDIK